jgi:hypothetical protein
MDCIHMHMYRTFTQIATATLPLLPLLLGRLQFYSYVANGRLIVVHSDASHREPLHPLFRLYYNHRSRRRRRLDSSRRNRSIEDIAILNLVSSSTFKLIYIYIYMYIYIYILRARTYIPSFFLNTSLRIRIFEITLMKPPIGGILDPLFDDQGTMPRPGIP